MIEVRWARWYKLFWCGNVGSADIWQHPAEKLCHIVFTVSKQDAKVQASGMTWSWFLVLSVSQLAWQLACFNLSSVGGQSSAWLLLIHNFIAFRFSSLFKFLVFACWSVFSLLLAMWAVVLQFCIGAMPTATLGVYFLIIQNWSCLDELNQPFSSNSKWQWCQVRWWLLNTVLVLQSWTVFYGVNA